MNKRYAFLSSLALSACFATATLRAADWPHWLGPDGTNRAGDKGFNADLSKYSPAWDARIGRGYSSVIVADGRAFAMGHDEDKTETVYCFDAANGKEIWKFDYPAELIPRMHPGGPNASATVAGERVLVISKDGQMFCLNAADGKKNWEANLVDAMGVKVPNWGFGGSPVVQENRVLVSAGKAAAFDLASGKKLWVSNEDPGAAYATPVPFERDGQSFIAVMNGEGLTVHDGADGKEIAHRPLKAQFNLLAPTPIVLDDGARIFISCNASSEMLSFDGKTLGVIWSTKELRNALNNSVVVGGVIYGIDGRQGSRSAKLTAMNLEDGKVLWTREEFGYGTTIGVGDSLLALTENGELVTAKLSPNGYDEQGRLKALEKTCWTTPTVADGRIYTRNDQGALICLKAG